MADPSSGVAEISSVQHNGSRRRLKNGDGEELFRRRSSELESGGDRIASDADGRERGKKGSTSNGRKVETLFMGKRSTDLSLSLSLLIFLM